MSSSMLCLGRDDRSQHAGELKMTEEEYLDNISDDVSDDEEAYIDEDIEEN